MLPGAKLVLDAVSTSDFGPTASWDALLLRSNLLRRLRRFFEARQFVEVETPLLSWDTVVDRHLDPIVVILPDDPGTPQQGRQLFLQTSPEFAMKRLLACGARAIYQITRAFRAGEQGLLHNPEFTMVEWYRMGDGLKEGMDLLAELVETLLELPATERLTYQEAFGRHVGLDPHRATVEDLQEAAARLNVPARPDFAAADVDAWLNLMLVECIEPHLGRERATILYGYPASQAALATLSAGQPPVAERFELYVHGIELANGYHELTDPKVLRRRNRDNNQMREEDGKPRLPEESRLLKAMEYGLPPCSGVALGLDRLVMVAAGAEKISDVMAFPIDRA